MKVFVVQPLDYDARHWPVGVHEVSDSEAHGLFIAGSVRPATSTEIEEAAGNGPAVETADIDNSPETATAAPSRARRRRSA